MNAKPVARRRHRVALLVALTSMWLVVGVGHAGATVQRGVSRDQVETATEKLAKEINAWSRALTQSRASAQERPSAQG